MRSFENLKQLPGTPEEIAWLDKRLETLTAKEGFLLTAALQRQDVWNAADAINRVLEIADYELCCPAEDYTQLGEYYLRYETMLPKELYPYTDMEKLGQSYMDTHPGRFVEYGYVRYPAKEPAMRYDGLNLRNFTDTGWSLKLELASEATPEGVWLKLPDYEDSSDGAPDEIGIALDALGVQTIDECTLLEAICIFPALEPLAEQYDSLADLIYDGQNLGFLLDEQGQGLPHYTEKLTAALEYEDCHRLDTALDIAQNLRDYDYVLETGLKDYAARELRHMKCSLQDPALAECFDYAGFAAERLEQQGYTAVQGVFIRRNEQQLVQSHRQTQDELRLG